jgi:DMSO/TMAO reductase YedYZ heme-binding membrane subunit
MNKASFLFLLLIGAMALIGAYNALFPVPASTTFIRFFALSGFLLLCVSLMLGPLMILWPATFGQLIEPRRAIGIACFVFVSLHILLLLAARFGFDALATLASTNPLITVPATIILFVLAVTSSDFAVKTLGPGLWKNVQRFNYLAFVLSFAHFILFSNGLFIAVSGKMFVNIAEVALVILGVLTVLLQVAGFMARKKKEAENKAKMAVKPEGAV